MRHGEVEVQEVEVMRHHPGWLAKVLWKHGVKELEGREKKVLKKHNPVRGCRLGSNLLETEAEVWQKASGKIVSVRETGHGMERLKSRMELVTLLYTDWGKRLCTWRQGPVMKLCTWM